MIIYPCRGIKGIDVDQLKVSKFGIKYDRQWAIIDKAKLGAITQSPEAKLTMIRQRFEKDPKTKTKYLVFSIIDAHKDVIATLPSAELRLPILKTASGELV